MFKKFPFTLFAIGLCILGFLFLAGPGGLELSETKVLFVGDMMFDRTIRQRINEKGFDHIFSCINSDLSKYDFVVGNLEGPITSNASVSVGSVPGDINNMQFTFPIKTAEALKENNIKVVSLANNHILNFGREGLAETRKILKQEGVGWFGDPYDQDKKSFTQGKLNIIGFNQFLGVDSVTGTVAEIKKVKTDKNFIIVFAHWGDEYAGANYFQKDSARKFIDAGADLVLGAHPHVIQEMETYKDKKIYYSLGNFIFDQWWSLEVRKGMGVEVTINDSGLQTRPIFFESSRDGRTCPLRS